jgi:glycosyltransferase involved in cell wall biosynthesis
VVSHPLTRLDLTVNIRFPGTRANGIQVAAMAEALAATGLNVDVVVPRRWPWIDVDPYAHYGVARTFGVQRLASLDTIDMLPARSQRVPFLVQSVTFGLRALARAAVTRDAGILLRDHYTLQVLVGGLQRRDLMRVAAEVHDLPAPGGRRRKVARALARLPAVVTISHGLREDLIGEGLEPDRILVAPDGVSLARFDRLPPKHEARLLADVPVERPTVVYAGQLYRWKGVDTLVQAMAHVPGAHLLVVGGGGDDLERVKALAESVIPERVTFTGNVAPPAVPALLAAADVIALPNSAQSEISSRYTSPLKLFEAMAAGRALVASDIPSLREVLKDSHNALLVTPDDPVAFGAGLKRLLDEEPFRRHLAHVARAEVANHDWRARARSVARFLTQRLEVEA